MGFRSVLALCAVCGCSLATDLNDLSGEAGALDADASDAGAEAGDAAGDACAPAAVCPVNALCTGFDNGLEQPFHDTSQLTGSTQVTQTEFVSCPAALEADLDHSTSGMPAATASASITTQSLSSVEVVLELDVWLPSLPSGTITAFDLRAGASRVSLGYAPSTWSLMVQNSNQNIGIAPRVGTWNHMKLDVVFSSNASVGSAKLSYVDASGQPQFAAINDATYGAQQPINSVSADLGLAGNPSAKATAYYDDVVFSVP